MAFDEELRERERRREQRCTGAYTADRKLPRREPDLLPLAVVVKGYYGVRHEGKLWLVTAWLVDPRTQEAVPERMIRVDSYQMAEGPWDYDNVQLPRSVIEGVDQGTPRFEVRSLPTSPKFHRRDLKPLPTVFP